MNRYFAVILFTSVACNPISRSHVDANVLEQQEFDALLRRDLSAHFGGAAVDYELLRKQPTQAGIAYPKYYAWVRVNTAAGQTGKEGAVRLAAIDGKSFQVTDYLPAEDIRSSPSRVDEIFPPSLCNSIKQRAGVPDS